MQAAKQIQPPEWMADVRSMKLMRVLGGDQNPIEAMYVGGCVRNHLLGAPVSDIDIATVHHPLQVIERLKGAGIRYVPTGLVHGTVTAVMDGAMFEITTLRKDIETDGRHAVIAFTDRWEVDAQRRDFTINTLLASQDGHIYDPTEVGLHDLEIGRVRFVGVASERICEDYLRIFRFFRFSARFAKGAPDAEALDACRDQAHNIPSLSRERVTQEVLKILAVDDPSSIIRAMRDCGVRPCASKPFEGAATLAQLCALQKGHDAHDLMARILSVGAMQPDYFEGCLMLSNAQKRQLETLAAAMTILDRPGKKKAREAVYKTGNQAAVQGYLLRLAEKDALPDLELLDILRYWQAPVFPVKAETLIEAGVVRGPELGTRLRALEEAWIKSDFSKIPKH